MKSWIYLGLSFFLSQTSLEGNLIIKDLSSWLQAVQHEKMLSEENISLCVFANSQEKPVLSYRAEKPLLPNSIIKVLTASAALDLLGENFRFNTGLAIQGVIKEGILEGNILIQGSGDPTFGSEFFDPEKKIVETWAKQIKTLGVHTIKGQILVEDDCFDRKTPASWAKEDVGNYYGAGAFSFNYSDNLFKISFEIPSSLGERTKLLPLDPDLGYFKIQNEVFSGKKGSGDRAFVFRSEVKDHLLIKGTLGLDNSYYTIKASLENPEKLFVKHLTKALKAYGVCLKDQILSSKEKEMTISYCESPSLKEIIYWLNKKSINLYAEALLKKLGQKMQGKGSYENGLQYLYTHLEKKKIDTKSFHLLDGSGLSPLNRLCALQAALFLKRIYEESYFDCLLHSLPQTKKEDPSSLKYKFHEKRYEGKLHFKTGFSSKGNSLLGVVFDKKKRPFFVCLISNHVSSKNQEVLTKYLKQLWDILIEFDGDI